jgi:ubiquinol-cytochrome c reductase cytochrome b subunit
MLLIAVMPFIGKWKLGHGFNVALTIGLLLGAGYLTVIAMEEDRRDPELQAAIHEAHRDGKRAVELAKAHGIPPEGVLSLLKEDPLTQGPRLFARSCASCHRFNGTDGTGRQVLVTETVDHRKVTKEVPATATDLGKFGSRDWLREVLLDYHKLFAPLSHLETTGANGEKINVGARFLMGDMASWSQENRAALTEAANTESFNALVEFLMQQSGRTDQEPIDAALAGEGLKIFENGMLKSGSLTANCVDCHQMHVAGEPQALSDHGNGGPMLTGYAGKDWLLKFLENPGDEHFYGEKNAMPAFKDTMSDKDRRLLTDWLVGDYYKPKK